MAKVTSSLGALLLDAITGRDEVPLNFTLSKNAKYCHQNILAVLHLLDYNYCLNITNVAACKGGDDFNHFTLYFLI